jgi:hypothetical protein
VGSAADANSSALIARAAPIAVSPSANTKAGAIASEYNRAVDRAIGSDKKSPGKPLP